MAWSSSGLGHRPLKAKIGGSNPLQATTVIFCEPFEAGHQLGGFAFFVPEVHQRHRAVLVDRHVRLGIYGLSLIRALNPCYFVSFDTGNGRNYEIAWILLLSQRAQCGDSKETPGQSVTVKSSSSIVPTELYYFVIAYIFGAQNDEIVQILRWRPPLSGDSGARCGSASTYASLGRGSQCTQMRFQFGIDAPALDCFLYGHIVGPLIKAILLDIGQRRIGLFR